MSLDDAYRVCVREIEAYRQQRGASDVQWVEVAHWEASVLGAGSMRPAAMVRPHVRLAGRQRKLPLSISLVSPARGEVNPFAGAGPKSLASHLVQQPLNPFTS